MKRMIAITIRPGAVTAAARVTAPWLDAATTPPPAATTTSRNVPNSSENRRRHSSAALSKSVVAGNSRPSSSALRAARAGLPARALWCLLIVAANLADPPWDGRAGVDS